MKKAVVRNDLQKSATKSEKIDSKKLLSSGTASNINIDNTNNANIDSSSKD